MNNVHEIKRIFDNPRHPNYGPVRRLWIMLEQLFPEGVEQFETRLKLFQDTNGICRPKWDEHLDYLIQNGMREADAQRTVITQLFTAREFIS